MYGAGLDGTGRDVRQRQFPTRAVTAAAAAAAATRPTVWSDGKRNFGQD